MDYETHTRMGMRDDIDYDPSYSQECRPPQKSEPKPQHKPLKLVQDPTSSKREAIERLRALFDSGKLNNSTFGE